MNLASIINPAGGLYYHLSALKHKNNLWKEFRRQLAETMELWRPRHSKLAIFGGSGGYTLPQQRIESYESVVLIDPDPLAPISFRRRFKVPTQWQATNYLQTGPQGLLQLKPLLKDHDVIFANVIGQLPLIVSNFAKEKHELRSALKELLYKESWFSYHDCLSVAQEQSQLSLPQQALLAAQNTDEIVALVCQSPGAHEVCDHQSFQQLPSATDRHFFFWPRKPSYTHLIEAIYQN